MNQASLLEPDNAEHVACLMRAIAHPVRLRLLALLFHQEENVSQLAAILGTPQAAISSHLAILRMNGMVEVRRANGFAWYRLSRPRLCEVLECLDAERESMGATSPVREV